MEKKIKIYCVLCDGMPLIPELRDIAEKHNLNILRQVGNCVTDASMTRMLTGKLPSDYLSQGFGYYTNRLEIFRDPVTKKINVPWYAETIFSWLQERDWKIHLHNVVPDSWFRGDIITDSYEGGADSRYQEILKNFNRYHARQMMNPILLNDDDAWRNREIKFIQSLPLKPVNTLYYIEYLHLHSYSSYVVKVGEDPAIKKMLMDNLMTLLKAFDLNEPDVLFWFFSDHGLQRAFGIVPPIDSYFSWVMTNLKLPTNLIAIEDFSDILKYALGFKKRVSFSKDRVFYVEDGRKQFDYYHSTTALACKVIEKKKIVKILQACYFTKTKRFYHHLHFLHENGDFIKTEEINNFNSLRYRSRIEKLEQKLKQRFEWVKEC